MMMMMKKQKKSYKVTYKCVFLFTYSKLRDMVGLVTNFTRLCERLAYYYLMKYKWTITPFSLIVTINKRYFRVVIFFFWNGFIKMIILKKKKGKKSLPRKSYDMIIENNTHKYEERNRMSVRRGSIAHFIIFTDL